VLGSAHTHARTHTRRPALSAHAAARAALDANTLRHAEGLPAAHALVCGPPGSGKSWMLWDGTLQAAAARGVRVVELSTGEWPAVMDAARGCGRYPRVRFILVADHLELPARGAPAADLLSGLSGGGGGGWPDNTLLYVGASSTSTVNPSDPLVARFGLVVAAPALGGDEGFATALAELAGGGAAKPGPEDLAAAKAWAAARGGPCLRTAAHYVRAFGPAPP